MRSNQNFSFSQVPSTSIERSVFNRTHGHKTTFDSGWLIPFYVDEVLPGDTFTAKTTIFARMSTPIKPAMDNIHMDTFYFFCPSRLVWTNWQKFMGEKEVSEGQIDNTEYLLPQVTVGEGMGATWAVGSIYDYMGLPTQVVNQRANALPLRAYHLIYNEWFRDENLIDKDIIPMGDGPDNPSNYSLRKRCKRHDYFTSCLPWPQKGPSVDVPLGGNAPVYGTGGSLNFVDNTDLESRIGGIVAQNSELSDLSTMHWRTSTEPLPSSGGSYQVITGNHLLGIANHDQAHNANNLDPRQGTGLYADLNETLSSSLTINLLRQAFQVQKMYERDARGGTRYIEIIRSHFGVISPDARLQRPEYLGGSRGFMSVNPVQQTSSTDITTPQGNLAGYITGHNNRGGFSKSFVEHGYIIGLVCVYCDITYQQGMNRMWSRRTREDFYWPSLAHLGEQPVYNQEIYADGSDSDGQVFGYQERYAEYRYFPSKITGKFRSTVSGHLDVWHYAQEFDSVPGLGQNFIEENPPIARNQAVTNEPQIFFDSYIELKSARPMPVYGTPGLIDHF